MANQYEYQGWTVPRHVRPSTRGNLYGVEKQTPLQGIVIISALSADRNWHGKAWSNKNGLTLKDKNRADVQVMCGFSSPDAVKSSHPGILTIQNFHPLFVLVADNKFNYSRRVGILDELPHIANVFSNTSFMQLQLEQAELDALLPLTGDAKKKKCIELQNKLMKFVGVSNGVCDPVRYVPGETQNHVLSVHVGGAVSVEHCGFDPVWPGDRITFCVRPEVFTRELGKSDLQLAKEQKWQGVQNKACGRCVAMPVPVTDPLSESIVHGIAVAPGTPGGQVSMIIRPDFHSMNWRVLTARNNFDTVMSE